MHTEWLLTYLWLRALALASPWPWRTMVPLDDLGELVGKRVARAKA